LQARHAIQEPEKKPDLMTNENQNSSGGKEESAPSNLISDFKRNRENFSDSMPCVVVVWVEDRSPIRRDAPPISSSLAERGTSAGSVRREETEGGPLHHTAAVFEDADAAEETRKRVVERSERWARLPHSGIEKVVEVRQFDSAAEAEAWSKRQAF
jgi:hypothetical protein